MVTNTSGIQYSNPRLCEHWLALCQAWATANDHFAVPYPDGDKGWVVRILIEDGYGKFFTADIPCRPRRTKRAKGLEAETPEQHRDSVYAKCAEACRVRRLKRNDEKLRLHFVGPGPAVWVDGKWKSKVVA